MARFPKEALEVLEAVSFAHSFGDQRHFDGDIALAIEDARGRGITPIEFFELIKRLSRSGYVHVRDARSRRDYMTNYVELTAKGYNVLVKHGRAEP